MGSLLKEASFVMNVKCKALFQHMDSERSVSREPEDFLQRVPDLSFKLGLRKDSKPKIKNKKVKKPDLKLIIVHGLNQPGSRVTAKRLLRQKSSFGHKQDKFVCMRQEKYLSNSNSQNRVKAQLALVDRDLRV